MPKSIVKTSSKSKPHTPYASSSSARPKRVTFVATERDEAASSESEVYEEPAYEEPNIRAMFARQIKNWPEENIRRFETHMRSPYPLSPIPSTRKTRKWECYFGCYISASEILKFAADYDDCPDDPELDPMLFLECTLSPALLDGRRVRLRTACIREEDKRRCPWMEEGVGDSCYVVVALSMTDYRRGCRPLHVEIRELTQTMGRKPIWWEAEV
ncbi:hypothetical protein EIP91_001635 [Steccherinum ochraceum]|uniref:Uncharacterized protein n=1 Tax=Steccherinum ochraceum TaxID=92696 RepID=A0A4R0RG67_9APHY|nr:hypothetical protein EIP91_001635 [Steccherinum ochraceum]